MEDDKTVITSQKETSDNQKTGWDKIKYLINHEQVGSTLDLLRLVVKHDRKWSHIIETIVTLIVAALLISTLIWLVDNEYLDKGAFGVMFGTVFGYMLSWRFGK